MHHLTSLSGKLKMLKMIRVLGALFWPHLAKATTEGGGGGGIVGGIVLTGSFEFFQELLII